MADKESIEEVQDLDTESEGESYVRNISTVSVLQYF